MMKRNLAEAIIGCLQLSGGSCDFGQLARFSPRDWEQTMGWIDRAGLTLADFDFYEIHEAFAAQVLCTLRAWEDPVFCRERLGRPEPLGQIDRERLNDNGGSLAAGHPFAATGGRIVAALAKALRERGSGRGVISICAAAGQGVLAVLEAP